MEVPVPNGVMETFGMAAIGVVSVLIVFGVFVWMWKTIVQPNIDSNKAQAEVLRGVAETMDTTAKTNDHTAETLRDTVKLQSEMTRELQRAAEIMRSVASRA